MNSNRCSNASTLRALAAAFVLAALGVVAQAQVPISGNVSDGAGGPLLSGVVYHASGTLTVPTGTTLTIQPGAVIKFTGSRLSVVGTLNALGTAVDPIVFTSLADDTAGGDTNGDGPSSGAPGNWQGIHVSGGTANVDRAQIRFGGSSGFSGLHGSGGSTITLTNSVVSNFSTAGVDYNNDSGTLVVSNTAFTANASYPILEVPIDQIPNLSNNTASGHGIGDYIRVTDTTPDGDVTIGTHNLIGDVVVFGAVSTINPGLTLTLEQGVIVKWSTAVRFSVGGTLNLLGSATAPVVLTSLLDDEFGGDTNKDGLSSGSAGDWQGVQVLSSGSATVQHAEIRFGGASGFEGLLVQSGGVASMTDSTIESCSSSAVDLSNTTSFVEIKRCDFVNNAGSAVVNTRLDTLADFRNNTASGNGGDYILHSITSPLADVSLTTANLINDTLVMGGLSTIPSGVTLRLGAGIIVKWSVSARFSVAGRLEIAGNNILPTVVTAFADDEYGGDTNKDGASSGSPGSWQGIQVLGSGTAEIRHALVRFGGGSGFEGLLVSSGGVARMTDTTVESFSSSAVDLSNTTSSVAVKRCNFVDNLGVAVVNTRLESLEDFHDNRASGNAGDYVSVSLTSPATDVALSTDNLLGDVLVFGGVSTIPAGVSLTLGPGVVVKWGVAARVVVAGSLNLAGTAFEPVVFTSLTDDAILGDTNKDGPSAGSPTDWQGIQVLSTAEPSTFENVLLRYSGSSGFSGFTLDSPLASARSIRVEHSGARGIEASALNGDAPNWVAFDCDSEGILLDGGSFDLLHATSVGNATEGIEKTIAFSGSIRNSISWGNLTNFAGFVAGDVFSSNGDAALAGSNGNINADPLFVDATPSVGDLGLGALSPSVDSAGTTAALAVIKDHAEHSRMLDPTLSGNLRADMGAYERYLWEMDVDGETHIGSRLECTVSGPSGSSLYLFGLLDGSSLDSPFGFITAGTTSLTSLANVPVGSTFELPIPLDPALIGVGFGVQTRTNPTGTPSRGSITNLYRSTVRAGSVRRGNLAPAPEIRGTVTTGV